MDKKINSSFSNYEINIKSPFSYLTGDLAKIKVSHVVKPAINDFSNQVDEMDLSLESELLPIVDVAKQVLKGEWGNGDERKKRLEEAGYNVAEVQGKVNEFLTGVNTYVPIEPIMETKDETIVESVVESLTDTSSVEPLVEPLTDTSSVSNLMGSKRILNAKKPEIIIDEFSMKESNNSTDVSSRSFVSSISESVSNLADKVLEKVQQVADDERIINVSVEDVSDNSNDVSSRTFVSNISEGVSNFADNVLEKVQQVADDERIINVSVEELNSIKNKDMYDKLSDTSNDEYKFMWLFGENKTTGLNGETILFDKISKSDRYGSILYYKDGKCIKYVGTDCVTIVDGVIEWTYFKDGSMMTKNTSTDMITHYDSTGKKTKEEIKYVSEGVDIKEIEYYDQNGNVSKKERCEFGDIMYEEYDELGNLVSKKDYDGSYYEYKGDKLTKVIDKYGRTTEYKDDGSVIVKDSGGNILKIEYTDGSSISWKFDGTKYKEIRSDGTEIYYYDEYKYKETKPDGSSTTYEFYENGNLKRESTPNGPYDSFYKEYDELGNLVLEKNEYAKKITYVDGKPDSFELSGCHGGAGEYITPTDNGDYVIKLNKDNTKVLQVIDPNGNIINDFGSGITLIKWWD